MTDNNTDATRQREQAATEGPWSLRDGWGPARDGLARCSRIANKQHDNVLHPEGRDIAGTVADLEFIASARTDVPALLAKVDELTAERDLNGDLLDGAARALGIDLEDPDVHYAFNIPTKVAEVVAALAQSREQAATYANEIGTLTAENARVRQQRDGLVAALTDAGNEVDLLTAETTRLRPVVEAAKTWRAQFEKPVDTKLPRMAALMAAIDALPKAEATR